MKFCSVIEPMIWGQRQTRWLVLIVLCNTHPALWIALNTSAATTDVLSLWKLP